MKKKKLLSLLLAVSMSASMLAGCGNGSGDNNGNSANEPGSQTPAEDSGTGEAGAIDMEEDPYEVAIQMVVLPGVEIPNEAELESAINEVTLPAINCTVDLQFEWISEVANNTSMKIAGGEKIDLVHVGTVQTLSTMVGSEILHDLNEDNLLQTRGTALVELFGDVMKAGEVNGQQLAVPANVYAANSKTMRYNKDMAAEYNLDIPEKGTVDDMEAALYAFHEANPDVMAYFVGGGEMNLLAWLADYESFGSESSYGVIFDDSMKVENLYTSELFKDYVLRMNKWRKDGILCKDATDTTTGQEYQMAHQLFASVANYNPYLAQQDGMNYDYESGYLTLSEPAITNSSVTEYMWGIASSCERPDKAMDFLNFLYSNADVANLLKYGIEGENYTFAEGSSTIVESNGSYNPMFYVGGNSNIMYVQAPATDDYIPSMQAFEESATASGIIGYIFDDSNFQPESAAIYSAILKYLPTLQNGACGSEEDTLAYLDEFIAALEAAGINDVIQANQEQLDAWLANK